MTITSSVGSSSAQQRTVLPVADNLLEQNFAVSRPSEAWVADITYIPTDEGWLYLAGIKDLFNGEIVGYAMSERMTRELCGKALFNAVKAKRPPKDLIHHSDRGSQYCSYDYQRLLKQFCMQPSMSRTGNCYDNAPMESFWGTLKNELVHHRRYRTRQVKKWGNGREKLHARRPILKSGSTLKYSTIGSDDRRD